MSFLSKREDPSLVGAKSPTRTCSKVLSPAPFDPVTQRRSRVQNEVHSLQDAGASRQAKRTPAVQ